MKKVFLILLAVIMTVPAVLASGRLTIGLSGQGWKLWRDADAQWADDKLYLPSESTDLSALPVNLLAGGWSVLDGNIKRWTDEDGVIYIGVIPFLLEDTLLESL